MIPILERDSLFDPATGQPNYESISMQEGLYNVLVKFDGNETVPVLLEKTDNENITYAKSNYLSVDNIYPNPISSGNITVELSAEASVVCDYTITSSNGITHYSRDNISIAKGQTSTIVVPSDDLPSGTLIHTFMLTDGSTISVNTIKQ